MARDSIQRKSAAKPAELLTRSRIEIVAILGAVLRDNAPLTAYLENGEQLMVTRLLHLDPDEGYIVVDYGLSRPANQLLLHRKTITFHCESGRQHVQFAASVPRETVHDGKSAIRLYFPDYLLRRQHRRHPRFRIPPELQVKCRVECPGVLSFEMDVQDISRAGLGMVTHSPNITLEPGTVLPGCQIKHPLHPPICFDLEIRHSTVMQLPDGTPKVRTGCRFIGDADAVAELVSLFSLDLGHNA